VRNAFGELGFRRAQSLINAFCQGELDNYGPRQGKILAGDFALNDGVSADLPQIDFV
jgi:hypothetical protein